MAYVNRFTGTGASGLLPEILQNLAVILTTPIGSRVMRRDFGSDLYKLVDSPGDRHSLTAIYAATHAAIARWEPRCRANRIEVTALANDIEDGNLKLRLFIVVLSTEETAELDISL